VAAKSWSTRVSTKAKVEELLAFPRGRHDDIVDALGLAGQLLDMWAPGGVPKLEPDAFRPRPLTTSHYTHGLTIRC